MVDVLAEVAWPDGGHVVLGLFGHREIILELEAGPLLVFIEDAKASRGFLN